VATAIDRGWLEGMEPAELAAVLVMVTAEDRGRERGPVRRRFPSPRVELGYRELRAELHHLAALEHQHGLDTLRPLSLDYLEAAAAWVGQVPLAEIESPPGNDLGDVVKAVKNLYSMLRQMEQALRDRPLRSVVARTRELMERDLIRRV
jgi:superfamily II RNA helicase